MNGGCTVILTLLKPENRIKPENQDLKSEPDDEQLHVLPHYAAEKTDEYGSIVAQLKKNETGELEILHQFERTLITRATGEKGETKGQ